MKFNNGDEVGFHGRHGIVKDSYDGFVVVYFSDIDQDEEIDIDELEDQQ